MIVVTTMQFCFSGGNSTAISAADSVCVADLIKYGCDPGKYLLLFPPNLVFIGRILSLINCLSAVIWSTNYELPFMVILDWKKSSVTIKRKHVNMLRCILKGISEA